METYLLFFFIFFVFIFVPITFGVALYYIPKIFGDKKIGQILSGTYFILLISSGIYLYFEDSFFSKNDAHQLLKEQNIQLNDDFKILDNSSYSAIGDYYHTFELEISEKDRKRISDEIKSDKNFKSIADDKDLFLYLNTNNRYFGKKIIQNYETEHSFVREYFEPSGRESWAPTFRRISISKTQNTLTFEDIDE